MKHVINKLYSAWEDVVLKLLLYWISPKTEIN